MGNDLNLIATEIVAALNRGDFGFGDFPAGEMIPGYNRQRLIDEFIEQRDSLSDEFESSLRDLKLSDWTEEDIKHYASTKDTPPENKLLSWIEWAKNEEIVEFYIAVPLEDNGVTIGWALIYEADHIEPNYIVDGVYESKDDLYAHLKNFLLF